MNAYRTAQRCFAALFCIAVVAYAAVCLLTRGPAIYAALTEINRPASLWGARAAAGEAENILHADLYKKNLFREAHAYFQRVMGKSEINGFEILRDGEGFLEYSRFAPYPAGAAQEQVRKLWRLQTVAAAKGSRFLFVGAPARHRRQAAERYASDLPYLDLHPFSDAVFYNLQRYGVAALDLRAAFEKDGLPFETYTFRTDDRMPAEAAFAAFRATVEALNRDFDAGLDPQGFYTDIRRYAQQTYTQVFPGHLSKRAGIAYGGLDDFTVLAPVFPSRYTLTVKGDGISERAWSGPGATTLLRPSVLEEAAKTRDPYRTDLYRFYMGGVYPYAQIQNETAAPDAPRLLLIHDGKAAPLAVFLAPLFREIRMVCPAIAESDFNMEGYLRDRLKTFPAEYVIVESGAGNLEYMWAPN
jgi:hypothetical protein